jgi:hypothetical protein
LTVDEFRLWQAYFEVEPWGELRADLRQAAGIAYNKAECLPDDAELPNLQFPYWENEQEETIDFAARQQAIEDHTRRWAEWERDRRNGKANNS